MKLCLFLAGALAFAAPAAAQHMGHGMVAVAPGPGAIQGAGVVKGVNLKAGTVTLHHGPIAALKWPAMTMTFKATPEALKAAKPGKSVTFTLNPAGDELLSLR